MKFLFSVLLVTSLAPAFSLAQLETLNQPRGFASLSLGLGHLSEEGSSVGYGVDLGLLFTNNTAADLFFLASGNQSDDAEAELSHFGVGADYAFSGTLENLRVGARLGGVSEVLDNESTTGFAIGPHVAYDYPLSEEFSIGAQGLLFFNSSIESETTTYVQATGRYWF